MPPENVGLLGTCASFFTVGVEGGLRHTSNLSLPQLLIHRKPSKRAKA